MITQEKIEEWEKEWNRRFFPANKNRPGFYTWNNPEPEEIEKFISQVEQSAIERTRKTYDPIFKWLLGENGRFPDLSQRPHYSFRSELRERLKSLLTNQ